MSIYQGFKDGIEAFQPGGSNAPILFSTTVRDDKVFRALLGRKLNSRPTSVLEWVFAIAVIIATVALVLAIGGSGAPPSFGGFAAVFYIMYFIRTSLVSVGERGLDVYFTEKKRGQFFVYDKLTLPYDKITNVKIRRGPFNTSFRFKFSHEGKTYKLAVSVANKKRNIEEQADNLTYLHEALEKRQLGIK